MYKLTVAGDDSAIYDSDSNPLPEGEVYFHTSQHLWKNNVILGRVIIGKETVLFFLGINPPIQLPRDKFQKIFMGDFPIESIFCASPQIKRFKIHYKPETNYISTPIHSARLYYEPSNEFFADIYYLLK